MSSLEAVVEYFNGHLEVIAKILEETRISMKRMEEEIAKNNEETISALRVELAKVPVTTPRKMIPKADKAPDAPKSAKIRIRRHDTSEPRTPRQMIPEAEEAPNAPKSMKIRIPLRRNRPDTSEESPRTPRAQMIPEAKEPPTPPRKRRRI